MIKNNNTINKDVKITPKSILETLIRIDNATDTYDAYYKQTKGMIKLLEQTLDENEKN